METLTVERLKEMNRGWVLGLFVSMEEDVPWRSFKLLALDLEIALIHFAKLCIGAGGSGSVGMESWLEMGRLCCNGSMDGWRSVVVVVVE